MTDRKKPVYIGVFLTPASRVLLLEQIPPVHPNIYADHVTIKYKPTAEDLRHFRLGQRIKIIVLDCVTDENGQAARVLAWPRLPIADRHKLHITISTAPKIQPVYSNELIEKSSYIARQTEIHLFGVVDIFPRTTTEQPITTEVAHG